jgi:GT2 family glycosyltransferase
MTLPRKQISRPEVIVPAHAAERTLPACLDALFDTGFDRGEIIVVDDGSTDRTGEIARAAGVRVVRHKTPHRPARARNKGAEHAQADILVFVDADVVVHSDLRERIVAHFANPDVDAVIGSYDTEPGGPVVSRYRNLLHHLTHQSAAGSAQTFWSGIGAMRREVFEAAGGFDPAWEDIEDVELGLRVTEAGGRILLDPSMQGRHLKVWTPRSMFRTDLYGRAVPWTRLLRSGRIRLGALNTAWPHRISAATLPILVAALLAATVDLRALWLAAIAVAAFLAANARLLLRLSRIVDPVFALRVIPYHALHYAAGLLGYLRVRFLERND